MRLIPLCQAANANGVLRSSRGIERTAYAPTQKAAIRTSKSPTRLACPDIRPSSTTRATPTMESPTPSTPFHVGRSRPRVAPSNSPHTGAVAKIRPVLPALERLTPNVKPVWAVATPKQPSAAIGSTSLLRSLLFGSKRRRTSSNNSPPTVNRRATSNSGEILAAAYFVAAKFRPQNVAARTSETSVAAAALSLRSNTGADCTVGAMIGWVSIHLHRVSEQASPCRQTIEPYSSQGRSQQATHFVPF